MWGRVYRTNEGNNSFLKNLFEVNLLTLGNLVSPLGNSDQLSGNYSPFSKVCIMHLNLVFLTIPGDRSSSVSLPSCSWVSLPLHPDTVHVPGLCRTAQLLLDSRLRSLTTITLGQCGLLALVIFIFFASRLRAVFYYSFLFSHFIISFYFLFSASASSVMSATSGKPNQPPAQP